MNFRIASIVATIGFFLGLPAVWAATKTESVQQVAGNQPASSLGVAKHVDSSLASEVFAKKSTGALAPRTDDQAFLRRASLDLVGDLPTPSEVTLFAFDPSPDKRQRLVERLLADPRFGTNWGRYWRDVILYRRSEDRVLLVARELEAYLTTKLNENTGWDKIAQAFITATGTSNENGEIALVLAQMAEPNDVASEASRIFLGIQIQCAQCHDHPNDRWKREQFHEFAAFFPRTAVQLIRTDGRIRGIEVVSYDFDRPFRRGNGQPGRGALEHYMPDLKDTSSKGKLMTPVFFATGRKLNTGVEDSEQRGTVAEWMTSPENGWFAKAFVNRLWAELVGEGFCEPIDDLGPGRPCSAPQTLQYLASEFAARKYDIKWLYQTIMATAAYERESRPRRGVGGTPFVANCSQRLRGDQLYDVLTGALGATPSAIAGRGPGGFYGGNFGPRSQFNLAFGYDPSVRRDEITGSIPQALVMMNSALVNNALRGDDSQTPLGKLLATSTDDEGAVTELYLRCFGREPNKAELTASLDYINKTSVRREAFEDLLWALVNRTEFLHRN